MDDASNAVLRDLAARGMARRAIGELLLDRAGWVRGQLIRSSASHIAFSEETITETLLVEVCSALPGNVTARTYTKYQESRHTGADWEWWFVRGPSSPGYGVRVQAKKLKRLRAGVFGYDFAYKPRNSTILQIDRLIQGANSVRLPAVYVLYNGPDLDLAQHTWQCCAYPESYAMLGVGMISARAARGVMAKTGTTQAVAGPLAKPWSCLLLCPRWLCPAVRNRGRSTGHPDGVPISMFAGDLIGSLIDPEPAVEEGASLPPDPESANALTGFRTWENLPDYVRAAVSGNEGSFEVFAQEEATSELAGVVVFTES